MARRRLSYWTSAYLTIPPISIGLNGKGLDSNLMSLIVGSLLSNSYLEKRNNNSGVRIVFIKCSNNIEYLYKFHKSIASGGYCSFNKPKLYKVIAKGNKVLFTYSFKSYSFTHFI